VGKGSIRQAGAARLDDPNGRRDLFDYATSTVYASFQSEDFIRYSRIANVE
jgi:hypothetical protein